jgi:hypothetical protein
MVCLRNISVDTLHIGDNKDEDEDDDDTLDYYNPRIGEHFPATAEK